MKLPLVIQLVRSEAEFQRYQDGSLWYRVPWDDDFGVRSHFDFPIPVTDVGGGEFLPRDKALTFMRWIRGHLEYLHGALMEDVYDQ